MNKEKHTNMNKDMTEDTKGMHRRLMGEARLTRTAVAGLFVVGALGALATAAGAWAIARVTDAVFLGGAAHDTLVGWFCLLAAAVCVRGILAGTEGYVAGRITSAMTAHLRRLLFGALHRGGPAFLSSEEGGELASSALRGVGQVALYYAQFLPQAARTAVIVPMMVLFVLPFDYSSAALLFITIPLLPVFMMLIGLLAKRESRRQWHAMSRLGAHLYDVLDGLGTLKLFGRSREQAEVVWRMSREFSDSTLRVLRVAFISAFVLELVTTMSTAVIAVSIGLRLVWGNMAFLDAFFVLLLIPECYLPLRKLGAQFHTAVVSLPAAARLFALTDAAANEMVHTERSEHKIEARPDIMFENVHYAYPHTSSDEALCGVSFTARGGSSTAVIGKSGSGKTTMLKLAAGLFSPSEGRVLLGGRDIREVAETSIREAISYVPQFPHLFRMTAAENIALSSAVDMVRVREAARLAGADDFLAALPNGYDTLVGDGGHMLSGGEVRRLALARAFYRGGHVLLLDEWTEGLDSLTEERVRLAMDELTADKTVIIVAHRLETASRCDYVAVMEDGRIVEYGVPSDLLADENSHFARLVREGEGARINAPTSRTHGGRHAAPTADCERGAHV